MLFRSADNKINPGIDTSDLLLPMLRFIEGVGANDFAGERFRRPRFQFPHHPRICILFRHGISGDKTLFTSRGKAMAGIVAGVASEKQIGRASCRERV